MPPAHAEPGADHMPNAERLRHAEALEAEGDLAGAFIVYRDLFRSGFAQAELAARMGRLALRSRDYAMAERVLRFHLEQPGPRLQAMIDLAEAQTGLGAYHRAIATLRAAVQTHADDPVAWLALGRLLKDQARYDAAVPPLEEALRLDPRRDEADRLLAEVRSLAHAADESPAAGQARRARAMLGAGELDAGWRMFRAWSLPGPGAAVHARVAAPLWTPGQPATGSILVFGEEDLSDEILLTQVVNDASAQGLRFILALDPRWLPLARRSFQGAHAVPLLSRLTDSRREHAAELQSPFTHEGEFVSGWTTLRALAAHHRSSLTDFGAVRPHLAPDPQAVAQWRSWLTSLGPGPYLGIHLSQLAGKSPMTPTPEALRQPLSRSGELILLQAAPLVPEDERRLGEALGRTAHAPPSLDLHDLDAVAALAAALDAVVGSPATASYIAAGAGTRCFLLAPPDHWAFLGSGRCPWFADAEAITCGPDGDWSEGLDRLGRRLAELG